MADGPSPWRHSVRRKRLGRPTRIMRWSYMRLLVVWAAAFSVQSVCSFDGPKLVLAQRSASHSHLHRRLLHHGTHRPLYLTDSPKDSSRLLELLRPPPSCKVEQMSSTDLAYIGDVVYELLVRSMHVWPPKRTSDLQTTVVALVRGT